MKQFYVVRGIIEVEVGLRVEADCEATAKSRFMRYCGSDDIRVMRTDDVSLCGFGVHFEESRKGRILVDHCDCAGDSVPYKPCG